MKERFINHIKIDWSQIGEDSYVRHIKALNQLNQLSFNHNITFFVGENGSGKSTLIEAIAVAYGFSAEGGTRLKNIVGMIQSKFTMIDMVESHFMNNHMVKVFFPFYRGHYLQMEFTF